MRHVFAARPVAPRRHGMPQPARTAGLVAPAGGSLGTVAGTPCALPGAVNLATVAAAADQRLGATARAHKQPGCRGADILGSTDVPWTNATIAGILARHACPARWGARRRAKPSSLTSAPCLPLATAEHLPRHPALLTSIPPFRMRDRYSWRRAALGSPNPGSRQNTQSARFTRIQTAIDSRGTCSKLSQNTSTIAAIIRLNATGPAR